MKLLVLDNYDSFTYNLVYQLRQLDVDFDVVRNDKITPDQAAKYDGILLSPGPGIPAEAGNMPAIIQHCAALKPMLGVCLGHQALAEYLGGRLANKLPVHHGQQTPIKVVESESPLFEGLDPEFEAGRYHSWEVSREQLPETIEVTAEAEDGTIMGLQHAQLPLFGLQFHPESIMTPEGPTILKNFINLCQKLAA